MNKETVLVWINDHQPNFNIFRIEREPYQLSMDAVVGAWVASNYNESQFNAVRVAINNFCVWHNIAKPIGEKQ